MKYLLIVSLLFISASTFPLKKNMIYLWPGMVPGEVDIKHTPGIDTTRKDDVLRLNEITNPAIEVFLPDPSLGNRAALVVCPGGGYKILAYDKEGTEVASWFNRLGFTVFVLQYRVPDKREGALQDLQRAIRIIRKDASKWNLDTEKIGVMGFSAGGNLCARASALFNKKSYIPVDRSDSLSCRPSFTMLVYPAYLDLGTGRTLTPELVLSKETPPFFIFQTADDPHANSALIMTGALRDARLPVELHMLPYGGHGYGLRAGSLAGETWPVLAEKWLKNVLSRQ